MGKKEAQESGQQNIPKRMEQEPGKVYKVKR